MKFWTITSARNVRSAATHAAVLLCLAAGLLTPAPAATDDEWDASILANGTIVTNHSGTVGGDNPLDMFGTTGGAEGNRLLFRDYAPAGTVHFVEWQTTANKTIRRINLVAQHDAHVNNPAGECDLSTFFRDAQHRGFSRFTLNAFNSGSSAFDILLYDILIPFGDDNGTHVGENARLYDPAGVFSSNKNTLVIDANVPVATTNRWRAEFTQVGCPGNESGPRIVELDGFLDSVAGPGLEKLLTSGPDADGQNGIDMVVEVGQSNTSAYGFTLTYNNPGGPDVLIRDTAPAEWQVTQAQGNVVVNGFLGPMDDGNGGTGTVVIHPANKKANDKSATKIEWTPDPGVGGDLAVDMQTRGHEKNGKFKPTSCGPLFLNGGPAQVLGLDDSGAETVLFEAEPLCLAAVSDLNGGGLELDGSGDEDADGFSDLAEACEWGTNPCVFDSDQDGDGVPDLVDNCPGTANLDQTDADGDGVGAACDIDDGDPAIH